MTKKVHGFKVANYAGRVMVEMTVDTLRCLRADLQIAARRPGEKKRSASPSVNRKMIEALKGIKIQGASDRDLRLQSNLYIDRVVVEMSEGTLLCLIDDLKIAAEPAGYKKESPKPIVNRSMLESLYEATPEGHRAIALYKAQRASRRIPVPQDALFVDFTNGPVL